MIDAHLSQVDRLKKIYALRTNTEKKRQLYAWHRPEVRHQSAIFQQCMALMLREAIGTDLGDCHVLDVGCGKGSFLRLLIEWGSRPENLVGTEYLSDRLEEARLRSPTRIRWHLGELSNLDKSGEFDLVSAHTVFSSVLDELPRVALAKAMWEKVKPGGWVQIFDFRFNNPKNQNVRKVCRAEIAGHWATADKTMYRSLLLAPPIARRLPASARLIGELLHAMFPFLRTHFIFMARKPMGEKRAEEIERRQQMRAP